MNKLRKNKSTDTTSTEAYNEAKIFGGNPNGLINLAGTNHQFATTIYKNQKKRTWFVGQVDLTKDINTYHKLPEQYKRSYDLILAQLITDDSAQMTQLMDAFNRYVTSPVVRLALTTQAMEEGLHAESYSTMAEDVAQDKDYIFNLQHNDEELKRKNLAIEEMYNFRYLEDDDPTEWELLITAGCNQILEELVFPGGFAGMLLMADFMPGSAELIREIKMYGLPTEKSVA